MIIDSVKNAERYFENHPLFEKAFKYILTTDLSNVPDGKGEIGEGLRTILATGSGKTAEASLAKFECHNKNIDIQVCLSGMETIGWKPRTDCVRPNGGYNEEKDVQLFHDSADTFFQLQPGQFAIFFPEDVHAPMIGEGEIRKLVVKVAVNGQ